MVTGPDLLAGTGVLADLVLGQRRALEQLVPPLAGGHRVGDEDQRGRAGLGHRGRADDRLAGAARQDHDAGAAVPEAVDGLLLVRPHVPAVLAQRDRVRLAVDVAGQVLGRPAQLQQHLLEVAALRRVHHHGVVVDAGADEGADLLRPDDLLEHRAVGGDQHQPVHRVLLQPQPAVAGHRVGDVDQQGVRHGVPRVAEQHVDDLLGVVPGGARVPQPERGQPVGVHVLRRPLQLGERRDRAAAVAGLLVVDLEQEGLVGLHDQGAVGHRSIVRHGYDVRRPPRQPVIMKGWVRTYVGRLHDHGMTGSGRGARGYPGARCPPLHRRPATGPSS